MIALSPALYLSAANALLADDRPPVRASWHGQLDWWLRDDHRPMDAVTSSAFVGHVGYWSHRWADISLWPFPLSLDCEGLARLAESRKVLTEETPRRGAILLRWSMAERKYVRASIVENARGAATPELGWIYVCEVIEGHVQRVGGATAGGCGDHVRDVRRVQRICIPRFRDRFVNWVDLDRWHSLTRVPA